MNFDNLFDAFVDLMEQLFYPGYVMEMTAEEFTFEFEQFKSNYA